MNTDILTFGMTGSRVEENSTLSVVQKAAKVADSSGYRVLAILIGSNVSNFAEKIKTQVDEIILIRSSIPHYLGIEQYAQALKSIVEKSKPRLVLSPHDLVGMELAPVLAMRMNFGFLGNCTDIYVVNGKIHAIKPLYTDRIIANILLFNNNVVTLQRGISTSEASRENRHAVISEAEEITSNHLQEELKVVNIDQIGQDIDLEKAEVIIAGGLGVGAAENFKLLHEIAEALGGMVGCSRPVADRGWQPYSRLIGISGKTVAPKLYIACGISGQSQHVAGMMNSKVIVAINVDKKAPIFNYANYGITKDLTELLPALATKIRQIKSQRHE